MKWVYAFSEGNGKDKNLMGGKDANLCEMTQIGLRVPPGFVITTEACLAVVNDPEKKFPQGLMEQVQTQLSDALPRYRTDVLCHAFIIGLTYALDGRGQPGCSFTSTGPRKPNRRN